ncbi:hypothetical protein [Rhizobium sp. FKL33]|uniref:hypothetical protein n=1 Tax=Rhizobium sp. FKL33 TaxID=2562307 RepID=UPI0010BFC572|nr:hypothetical protein [Rhizobium sp. FKL33]
MSRINRNLLLAHIGFWGVLALIAFMSAESYRLFSCWQILLFYLPPLMLAFIGLISISTISLIILLFSPELRTEARFVWAGHGAILSFGLIGINYAAHLSAGQDSCL